MEDQNIHRLRLDEKEIILIGTAHVSQKSAELVKQTIEEEKPDSVCVELDTGRYQSIQDPQSWRRMDIASVIRQRKTGMLLVNLILSSYQRRIAEKLGVQPGQEMRQGIDSAKEIGAQLVLADRNIQTTFSRVWNNMGFWGKLKLFSFFVASLFSREEISEEELEELKSSDMLSSSLSELAKSFPQLKTPLIDERDQYLAKKIQQAPGKKVVAVLGAGHIPGVKQNIDREINLQELDKIPPKSRSFRWLLWAIPVLIIGLIAITFVINPPSGFQQVLNWVVWNGSLSAIGGIVALAHPLTILASFLAAPFTSLNPLIGAGIVAGLVEVAFRKPQVEDFENLNQDVLSVRGFWRNKVTRLLLVVLFVSLGSTLGTFIGGLEVARIFIGTV